MSSEESCKDYAGDGWEGRWKWFGEGSDCGECYILCDLNHDGVINLADVKILSEEWFSEDAEADIYKDEDNIVNFRDFAVLAGHWLEESL